MRYLKLCVQLHLKHYGPFTLTRGVRRSELLNRQWGCAWYVLPAHMLVVQLEIRPGIRRAYPLAALPDGLLDMQ